MTERDRSTSETDRGAAMVEFALILPLLLLLLFGIIEFGRAYNVKVQLTGSVREGARAAALGGTAAQARTAVKDAAPGLNPALADGDIAVTLCPATNIGNATVTVTYDLAALTPLVPSGSMNIDVTGVMRCGL